MPIVGGSIVSRLRALWLRSLVVGAATGLCGALLIVSPLGTALEQEVGLAWLFQLRGPIAPPPAAAVVAINGITGSELGLPQLPRDWPRTVHAALVKSLTARQVAVPSPLLANAATALAPFALPKRGQAAVQFWSFKASLGDLPTTAAVALQLYALPLYERWREVLAGAGAEGLDDLPPAAAAIRRADEVRMVMGRFRQTFLSDPALADRVRARLDAAAGADGDARLLRALVARLP